MLGGRLLSSQLALLRNKGVVVGAYAHQLYLFDAEEAVIRQRMALHSSRIVALCYEEETEQVVSLDEEGVIVRVKINEEGRGVQLDRKNVFGTKRRLRQAKTSIREQKLTIYAIDDKDCLLQYSADIVGQLSQKCTSILVADSDYLIFLTDSHTLHIHTTQQSNQKPMIYTHKQSITSAAVHRHDLLVADSKGKIHLLPDYLLEGKVILRQKLEWHTHAVSSMKVQGSYLYSAGEEGVVVLWHLRQHNRDFLPRLGCPISDIIVDQEKVYCMLVDNSIKAIDLNNDKQLKHYRAVVSPSLAHLHQHSASLTRGLKPIVTPLKDRILMRGLPGRLQQLNLFTGQNKDIAILNRNLISRLDSHLPCPHQITDLALSKDQQSLAVSVEGVNCRSLRFYKATPSQYTLLSGVDNCHTGNSQLHILCVGQSRFLTYTQQDPLIKIWGLHTRKKQSLTEAEQQYWACDVELSHRQMCPLQASVHSNQLLLSYKNEIVLMDMSSGEAQEVCRVEKDNRVVAAHQLRSKQEKTVVVAYENRVMSLHIDSKGNVRPYTLIKSTHNISLTSHNIVVDNESSSLAIFIPTAGKNHLYFIKSENQATQHYEISTQSAIIDEIFWLGDRLIAIDSALLLHDLTHQQQIIQPRGYSHPSRTMVCEKQQELQPSTQLDFSALQRLHLAQQHRKDQVSLQKNSQNLALAPSLASSFEMLAQQLLL